MAYIIPLNNTMQRLRLADTFAGLALAGSAVYIPLAVYILSELVSEAGRRVKAQTLASRCVIVTSGTGPGFARLVKKRNARKRHQ